MIVNLGLMAYHGTKGLHGSKVGPSGLHRAGLWMSSSPRIIFFSILLTYNGLIKTCTPCASARAKLTQIGLCLLLDWRVSYANLLVVSSGHVYGTSSDFTFTKPLSTVGLNLKEIHG